MIHALWSFQRRDSVALVLAEHAGALLLVAMSTIAGLLVSARWGNSPVVMLYLPAVLAAAVYGGLWSGLFAAVTSTLAYNFYFTVPLHTFAINQATDVVTVIVLFLVAVVSSHLAALVRRQAQLASEHASRNATIAGFARKLLSSASQAEIAKVSACQFAELFVCHAVVIGREAAELLAAAPNETTLGPSEIAAATYTLEAGQRSGRGEKRGHQIDWQFHPVISKGLAIAAVGLAREDGAPPLEPDRELLFESLLDQMALAFERTRLEIETRESAAFRVRDKLRSALLTAIGDDVKPRLKEIQMVVKGLRREGGADRSLISKLDSEIGHVERYIDHLVDLNPGSEYEPLVFDDVVIDLHSRTVHRAGARIHLTPKEFAVFAELSKHAGKVLTHAQLLRAVWGPAHQDHVDYLRVAVRALRQKLENDPANPLLIVNEPGIGYRLSS